MNQFKIATPISDLFTTKDNIDSIVNISDCLECRDHSIFSKLPNQELFHCELQPIHELSESEINYLKKIKLSKPHLKLISFHLGSCYKTPILKNGKFYPRGNKISRNQLIKNSFKNISLIKNIFGSNINIAVENNNHYKTEAYDYITCPDFINEVVNSNNINFLYDIAHSKISSHNLDMSIENYENKLPMDKLIQIHIANPGYNKLGEIYDKHAIPTLKELNEVIILINKYPKIKYLTVEYYKSSLILVKILKQLKTMLN
tara:strand:- start:8002 stop:8781 length:780 start_codon:yes stop_codon:yes gene_type:complete